MGTLAKFMDGGTVEQTCPQAKSDPTETPRRLHADLKYRDAAGSHEITTASVPFLPNTQQEDVRENKYLEISLKKQLLK